MPENISNKDEEQIITEKIQTIIEKNKNLTDTDIEKMVTTEIANAQYLKESWQIQYATRRIMENILNTQVEVVVSDIEPTYKCPKCGSSDHTPNKKVWVYIAIFFLFLPLWPLYWAEISDFKCKKCKKGFNKNPEMDGTKSTIVIAYITIIIVYIIRLSYQ